jgi:hypothetical protein
MGSNPASRARNLDLANPDSQPSLALPLKVYLGYGRSTVGCLLLIGMPVGFEFGRRSREHGGHPGSCGDDAGILVPTAIVKRSCFQRDDPPCGDDAGILVPTAIVTIVDLLEANHLDDIITEYGLMSLTGR